jgi:hypothetical protein
VEGDGLTQITTDDTSIADVGRALTSAGMEDFDGTPGRAPRVWKQDVGSVHEVMAKVVSKPGEPQRIRVTASILTQPDVSVEVMTPEAAVAQVKEYVAKIEEFRQRVADKVASTRLEAEPAKVEGDGVAPAPAPSQPEPETAAPASEAVSQPKPEAPTPEKPAARRKRMQEEKGTGKPAEAAPVAPAKRDEYLLGKTDREDRFFGTKVRVLPELKGDTPWNGTIQMTLNGGRLFSVKRDDSASGSFRIGGDRLEILEVQDAEKEQAKPKGVTPAPASINMLPLAERWDALTAHTKNDGGDPDKGQRSYRALTQFVGGIEEKPSEVWDRWSSFIGSTDLVNNTGTTVMKWLESNLPTDLGSYMRGLPSNTLSTNAGDASYWQKALAEIERRTPDHNRYIDKLEKRALDVERLGGDADKVAAARKEIDRAKREFSRNERTAQQALAGAEAREKEQAAARESAEAAKYKPFDAKELSKKPTPASLSGWFTATYDNKTVWTQGQILDISGEPPHLAGYADRMSDRNKDGKLDVSRVIPRQKGPAATPIGYYDGEFGSSAKNGVVYLEAEGDLIGVNTTFFRYFASKFKGATYFASPDGGAITVESGGKKVGVIMPIKLGGSAQPAPTLAEIRAKIDRKPATPTPQSEPATPAAPQEEAPAAAQPEPAPEPTEAAPTERNEPLIEARKRLSVLKALRKCIG